MQMLESVQQPCEEEMSGEEEMSVLPRHTKVVVTGNNRTKCNLVGLRGYVKKATGLGGWHWLVLTNGEEVKLQRNALSVDSSTKHEGDEENECENMNSSGSELASEDLEKPIKSKVHHRSVASVPKGANRNHSSDLQSLESKPSSKGMLTVNLSKLETEALRRYWKHFNLADLNTNLSKDQLLKAVEKHFISQQLDELQVIAGFVKAAKRLKTVCS